ncbi:MAG: hypothetical protein Q9160_001734 [Pyrenula sp. 1 TL-2023]
MATEDVMDIDIDLDGEYQHEEELELGEVSPTDLTVASNGILYNDEKFSPLPPSEVQSTKINISNLTDQVTTDDLVNFATQLFPSESITKRDIEWINDESANIVYPSSELAAEALASFTSESVTLSSLHPLQPRSTKPTTVSPNQNFQVRTATMSDKKQARAYEASRFYLLHPEHDPRERMRKEFRDGQRPRRPRGVDGEANGDYRRNRYDDKEHNRRLRGAADSNGVDFTASMYDDDAAAVSDNGPSRPSTQNRRRKRELFDDDYPKRNGRDRSASPLNSSEIEIDALSDDDANYRNKRRRNNFRARSPPLRRNKGKELFGTTNAGKELFNGSSTTMLQSSTELFHDSGVQTTDPAAPSNSNNRRRAANLRKELLATSPPQRELFPSTPKELFPAGGRSPTNNKPHHHRSNAEDFDSPNSSLSNSFSRLSYPLVDGVAENESGLSIKGAAAANKGLNIKGRGMRIKGMGVRELFPEKYANGDVDIGSGAGNQGKELFDHVLEGRGNRGKGRVRAGDLFG